MSTKRRLLLGWRKFIAYSLALLALVVLSLLNKLTAEAVTGLGLLLGAYVGSNAATHFAKTKDKTNGAPR